MHFTEDMFEQAVIELFENMGYTHIYAPDMERDYSSPLLDAVLLDSLVKLNKGLPLDAIQRNNEWDFVKVYTEMLTPTLIQMHPTCTQIAP